jgi:hypothetical protein
MIWKALVWVILMTFVVSGAKADTYERPFADMQGTGDTTSGEFTDVVVMFAFGQRVIGLMNTLPPSVHLIRNDKVWENNPPHIRKWFQSLMQPDFPQASCCGEADAYEADLLSETATIGSQSLQVKARELPINRISPKAPTLASPTQK